MANRHESTLFGFPTSRTSKLEIVRMRLARTHNRVPVIGSNMGKLISRQISGDPVSENRSATVIGCLIDCMVLVRMQVMDENGGIDENWMKTDR